MSDEAYFGCLDFDIELLKMDVSKLCSNVIGHCYDSDFLIIRNI